MYFEEDVGVKDLEANMKRLLIRLAGLIVTLSIVLSTGGMALAAENDGQDNGTGVASTQPAELPDTLNPVKGEEQLSEDPDYEPDTPVDEPAAGQETPADNPAGAPDEDPDGAPADPDVNPADPEAPAEEPAGAPAEDPADPAKEKESPDEPNGQDSEETEYSVSKTIKAEIGKSNDELAEEYINRAFGISSPSLRKRSVNYEAELDGLSLDIYRFFHSKVSALASGEESSTILNYPEVSLTKEDLGLPSSCTENQLWAAAQEHFYACIDEALNTLLRACPYELYWFDKTVGLSINLGGYTSSSGAKINNIRIIFAVANDYRENPNDANTVKSAYGTSVITARENALNIIEQNASLDDYNKLKTYKDLICSLTDYNKPAAQGGVLYGNPWQMIWVFDYDPDTKVVCEGYSKAFQFLCDNSTFQNDIRVDIVTGTMDGERHMWNVVQMEDGKSYLVDVTNCDSLARQCGIDVLFLRGKYSTLTTKPGYIISITPDDSDQIEYAYDTDGSCPTPDISFIDYVYNPGPQPVTQPVFSENHGMVLAGEIGVRFIVSFPENFDATGCYVDFEISCGRTGRIDYSDSAINPNDANQRYFIFYVNPIELADTITATLHFGDNETRTNQYSAMEYIKYVQKNMKDDPKWTELYNLINSLHDYGYYMQQSGWIDGNTHTPIEAPVKALNSSDIAAANEGLSNFTLTKSLGGSGIEDSVKVGLSIASQTELRVSVKPGSDVTMVSTNCTPRMINNEQYYQFSRKYIGPKALGDNITFTVVTDQGTAVITASVMYYVKTAIASDLFTEAQKYALAAYYNYYVTAMAYPY